MENASIKSLLADGYARIVDTKETMGALTDVVLLGCSAV
jgi:hypothetical protein